MPTTTLDLLDGGHAEIRDPRDVPERKRKAVIDSAFALAKYPDELANIQAALAGGADPSTISTESVEVAQALFDVIPPMILALVKSWDYGPVDEGMLMDEVPGRVYDQLRDHCLPMFRQIIPQFDADSAITTRADGKPEIDRASPTPPSAG